jgi:hypothetical protein
MYDTRYWNRSTRISNLIYSDQYIHVYPFLFDGILFQIILEFES